MRYTIRILIIAALALAGTDALAQFENFPEMVREKIRITPEQLERAIEEQRQAAAMAKPGAAADAWESLVSPAATAESEVHAAINPLDSNNIIVSPISTSTSVGLACPIYYTRDFGETWSTSSFRTGPKGVSDALVVGGGDPILTFDADGTAYLFWINLYIRGGSFQTIYYGMFWAYSTDGGATWRQAASDAVARSQFQGTQGTMYDKEWAVVDRTSSPYRNTVYVSFVVLNQGTGTSRIMIKRKPAGTAGFPEEPVMVSGDSFQMVQFANIDVDPEGGVHVTFFGTKPGEEPGLWHASSTDGGATFRPATKISGGHFPRFSVDARNDTIQGIIPSRIYPCPQLATDKSDGPTRGNLYLAWTADGIESKGRDGLDIYFSRSVDNGATWSAPIIVNDDERGRMQHQFYPSIAVNERGVVTVTWYDRRADGSNRMTDYYMAHSFDGGLSFAKNFPVSSEPTDFATIGARNQGFGVGEYTQVLSTPGHAVAVWSDGRGNAGDLDIYAAFVPIGGTVTGIERGMHVSDRFELLAPTADALGLRLAGASHVLLRVHDVAGRVVATVADGSFEPGTHRFTFDRAALPSGTYYCRLETAFGEATRAFVVAH